MSSSIEVLTGQINTNLAIIEDPRVGKHTHEGRAQLRTLPYIKKFGFDKIIHTELWDNEFKLVEYDHIDPEKADIDQLEFPLVHVVSQEGLVEYGEEHLMRKLLQKRCNDDVYIIVTDTDIPSTPSYTSSKPIVDEFTPNVVKEYEPLLVNYISENLDSKLPVSETKNLYYHKISNHHERVGAPSGTLTDLFDYDKAPPESPAWNPLYYFVEHDLEEILDKYSERIRGALRSWTERGDVQSIANSMDIMLTRCSFDKKDLDKQRKLNAELY